MNLNRQLIKDNSELRLAARKQLRGNWGMSILLIIVFAIITSAVSYIGPRNSPFRIGIALGWILSGPFELGLSIAFLTIVRTQTVKFETIFDGFKKFGQSFLVQLLKGIFILLWGIPSLVIMIFSGIYYASTIFGGELPGGPFILLIILSFAAGILPLIASLRYSLVFYILSDNSEIAPIDTLKQSSQMMKGFKGKLFLLYLSFIGWFLLGILALGIGLLWVVPYVKTSEANFYENLKTAYNDTEDFNNSSYIET